MPPVAAAVEKCIVEMQQQSAALQHDHAPIDVQHGLASVHSNHESGALAMLMTSSCHMQPPSHAVLRCLSAAASLIAHPSHCTLTTSCSRMPLAVHGTTAELYKEFYNPPKPTAAERERIIAEYEANQIEELLQDGISSLGVAQIANDIGFTSDAARRFIARMRVGVHAPRAQPGV